MPIPASTARAAALTALAALCLTTQGSGATRPDTPEAHHPTGAEPAALPARPVPPAPEPAPAPAPHPEPAPDPVPLP
ncbi:hypothetical protein, partial [Actinokineospora spheciospongiae]|uniref:hypothetical protein n=1 Tax=Actinokineospora spheciospongiae TaxID=909613 RepID=UPI0005578E36